MPYSSINRFKTYFNQRSHSFESPAIQGDYRHAAVLLLIYPGLEELELVLTRRSEHLPQHAGQISLPGGTVELSDKNRIHTALREAEEEIGLERNLVDVEGVMPEILLPSGFLVTPIVSTMPLAPDLVAEPNEVEEIFSIPLRLVLDKKGYKQDSLVRNNIKRSFYFIDYKDYYIWGATAAILRSLALSLPKKAI